ncbi:MAG: DNA recombination protein RmuC, partial [Bacteroidales bacterium]|nr:DNA recombination protein RmuC [Bacteroidales bacterium]
GDWGEQVLENILENSGLRKDHEYFIQHNIKGENNSNIRPDVLIKCPGNKYIVVDSKVSLTAYIDYVNAQTPDQQQAFAKANRDSVKAHIDELASVNYAKYVDNTIEHVLMFVPNEGSYILALQTDPQIGQYAFKKGVLLINPTNLMMSLQLIYNIWQSERQAKNVETIVSESEALYEKFVTFIGTFSKLKKDIESVSKTFDTAENQLTQGRGNIVRRLENLKTLGVTPKKQIDADYVEKSDI